MIWFFILLHEMLNVIKSFTGKIEMAEVEDIMDDQCIITSEFNVAFAGKHSHLVLPVR